jgi:alkylation response protein AidB-like acyl-CoA dehydrogenase
MNHLVLERADHGKPTAHPMSGGLVERMRKVVPAIAERAAACEEARKVPDANVALMHEIGFTTAFVPKAYGGAEEAPAEVYAAGRLLAQACPSTGWAMQLLTSHGHMVAAFDRRAQDDVWAIGPEALVCSAVAPVGKFERTSAGLHVSGRFRFSSGCDHAQWAMVGGLMENVATGAVEPHLALVPRSDFRIEDTWFTVGLKGSGSKDLCVEGVLVPDYRVEALSALGAGVSRGVGSHEGMIFRIPFMATFGASFAVAALGMADGMLAAYTDRLKRRSNAITGAKASEGAPSYMRLAQSSHEIHAASLILAADWADYAAHGRGEKTISQDTLVHWRANQAFAIKLLRDAVNRLYEASGGGAGFLDQPTQRYWRDINMASGHVFADYDAASQVLGRHLLGLAPDPSLL